MARNILLPFLLLYAYHLIPSTPLMRYVSFANIPFRLRKQTNRTDQPLRGSWHKAFPLSQNHVKYTCEFGIEHNRYALCCVALVGEKAISLPLQSCSEGMVSYPKLAN